MAGIKEWFSEFVELGNLQLELNKVVHSTAEQKILADRFAQISKNVNCPHNASHILSFAIEILSIPKDRQGCIVEAGCFKGGSTAKFSIAAKMAGRSLVVFDSFQGLPANQEAHDQSILGHSIKEWFAEGKFAGTKEEVISNITKYGEIDCCEFIEGWFEDTLPLFNRPISAAYIDVDLASSTKTCLKYIYPLLVPGGAIYSQDGDFPLVIDVFSDEKFWQEELGCAKPHIEGLGKKKIIRLRKPTANA